MGGCVLLSNTTLCAVP